MYIYSVCVLPLITILCTVMQGGKSLFLVYEGWKQKQRKGNSHKIYMKKLRVDFYIIDPALFALMFSSDFS